MEIISKNEITRSQIVSIDILFIFCTFIQNEKLVRFFKV